MSSRCLACDERFTDEELLRADDLCKKCLHMTFGDTSYQVEISLTEEDDDNE